MKSRRGRGASQKNQQIKRKAGRPKRVQNDPTPTYDICSSESDEERERPTERRKKSSTRTSLQDQSKTQVLPPSERTNLTHPTQSPDRNVNIVPVIKDLKVCPKACKCPPPVTWYGCIHCSRVHKSRDEAKMHRKSHISSKRNSSNEDLNAKELDTFGDDKDESRAEKVPIPVMESMRDKTSSSDAEEPQESDEEDSNASAVMFKLNKKAQKFCGDKAIIIDISDDDENDHGEQNGIEELCDID